MIRTGFRVLAAGLLLVATIGTSYAGPIKFTATLSGAAEAPPNASAGTGFATVIFDTTAHTLQVDVTFSGLTGTTTASHIHCCTAAPDAGTAGVATVTPTFTGFPGGVTSGTYSHLFDLTIAGAFNPAYVTANGGTFASAEAALLAGMLANASYLNIHTSFAPGGEIRGFLHQVPEPSALSLLTMGCGALLLGIVVRRARRTRWSSDH